MYEVSGGEQRHLYRNTELRTSTSNFVVFIYADSPNSSCLIV